MKTDACIKNRTRLAQSVERQPFKLVVEGSSPSLGVFYKIYKINIKQLKNNL